MKKIAEWVYFTLTKLSLVLIAIFCGYMLVYLARNSSGSDIYVYIMSYLRTGAVLACLLAVRHCTKKIFSILFPYTIDGDKLLQDYDLAAICSDETDSSKLFTLKPASRLGSTITILVNKKHRATTIHTTNKHLFSTLGDIGWSVKATSKADPEQDCYIINLAGDTFFLSEYQTIDLFCYLMAEKGDVKDADAVDEEISKYLSGVGMVGFPG